MAMKVEIQLQNQSRNLFQLLQIEWVLFDEPSMIEM